MEKTWSKVWLFHEKAVPLRSQSEKMDSGWRDSSAG